jgi:hypothetical protein
MIDLSTESNDRIADWIEVLSASQPGRPLSIQRIQDVSETFANLSPHQIPYALRLIDKRSDILGSSYPFQVDESFIVTRKSVQDSVYLQLLFLTPGSGIASASSVWNLEIASKLFEDITENSLHNFFGLNTHAVNFGFPSRNGRPAEFASAIEWLSKKTNIRLGSAYRPPRKKDGGVDLFVWKSFGDRRPGIPVMLVQCTIKDDFINKIGDIDIRLWSSWLSSDIEPLVALAVPGMVTKDDVWSEITTRGILLDRTRLVESCLDTPSTEKLENLSYLVNMVNEIEELVH